MSFKHLHIRYQTARSLPAPYAYFYTLTARLDAPNALQVDLVITYPDRDDIDDDELMAEGYTRDDDFSWSGRLPKTWLEAVANLIAKTRLQPLDEDVLGEDDDFWDMTIEDSGSQKQGKPTNAADWQYLIQELIQAAYESNGRERPFELTYLNLSGRAGNQEVQLTASFVGRTVQVTRTENQREQTKTLPWASLQRIMSQVYEQDFIPEDAQLKRPTHEGHWLNIGSEEWYDLRHLRALTKSLQEL